MFFSYEKLLDKQKSIEMAENMDEEQNFFDVSIRSPRPHDDDYNMYMQGITALDSFANATPKPVKKSYSSSAQLQDNEAKGAFSYLVQENKRFIAEYYTCPVCRFFRLPSE